MPPPWGLVEIASWALAVASRSLDRASDTPAGVAAVAVGGGWGAGVGGGEG